MSPRCVIPVIVRFRKVLQDKERLWILRFYWSSFRHWCTFKWSAIKIFGSIRKRKLFSKVNREVGFIWWGKARSGTIIQIFLWLLFWRFYGIKSITMLLTSCGVSQFPVIQRKTQKTRSELFSFKEFSVSYIGELGWELANCIYIFSNLILKVFFSRWKWIQKMDRCFQGESSGFGLCHSSRTSSTLLVKVFPDMPPACLWGWLRIWRTLSNSSMIWRTHSQ